MKKICLIFILLLFTVGAVAAVNPDDFKTPDGYEKVGQGTGGFYEYKNGSNLLDIYDWDGLYNIWFGNYDMNTCSDYDNNIYVYTDAGYCGYQELVEHDGKTYLIVSFIRTTNTDVPNELYDTLVEFNKIDNVKPTPV